MQLFFAENIESDICELTAEESKHCVKVLRMGVGDALHLTDGSGTLCLGTIISADPKACVVQINQRFPNYGQRSHYLHIAVAPTKNTARLEWFIEKAVEVGIDEITPLVCDHSERTTLNTDRLEKIILSAMKQSLKAYKPRLNQPTRFNDLVNAPFDGQRFICHCEGDQRTPLRACCKDNTPSLILIGPEGDFSPAEVSAALSSGFQPVTLGSCRLRTETAALYAAVAINFVNEPEE